MKNESPGNVPPRAMISALLKSNPSFAHAVSDDFEKMLPSFPIYGLGDIYFGKKNLLQDGMFMLGDAAQSIAPLAGDGMGMAMESAKIVASVFEQGRRGHWTGDALSNLYVRQWKKHFAQRLWIARSIQRILLSPLGKWGCEIALKRLTSLLPHIIQYTRGHEE